VFILILFASSIFLLFYDGREVDDDKLLFEYSINQNIKYDVDIYESSLFEVDNLGMNQTYVANLVRDINFNFAYNYIYNIQNPLTYEYSAKAIIRGNYSAPGSSEVSQLVTREFDLIERTFNEANFGNQVNINEDIVINYSFFNDIVNQFRDEINLPISALIEIIFEVRTTAIVNNRAIPDTKVMRVSFPLNQQAFRIALDYESEFSNSFYEEAGIIEEERNLYEFIPFVLGVLLILIMKTKFYFFEPLNNYQKKIKKILKTYSDIIVIVNSEISKEGLEIVEVKSFDEMLDLEAQLNYPIVFWERQEKEIGEFTFVHQGVLYKYVLTNETDKL